MLCSLIDASTGLQELLSLISRIGNGGSRFHQAVSTQL
jgi:hypothetical protein